MPKNIYLDQNVFMAILKNENPELRDHINACKTDGSLFPYSPAHIEEVAVIPRELVDPDLASERVEENIQLIAEISDCWEFLPAINNEGPSRLLQEAPHDCWDRVIDCYDLTLSAEENEKFQMSFKSAEAFDQVQEEFGTDLRAGKGVPLHETKRADHGIDVQRISNLTETTLFADPDVHQGLESKLWHYGWKLNSLPKGIALQDSHKLREIVVNLVLAYLEEIGYRADPFKKYRSRMHDVSHAIYASAADDFVTGDKRYRQRVKAAYHFLAIPTAVMSIEDFLA